MTSFVRNSSAKNTFTVILILTVLVCTLFLFRFSSKGFNNSVYTTPKTNENVQPKKVFEISSYRRRHPIKSKTLNKTKWIVVTSIASPTVQIRKLSEIPDWQLLVVADKKTPTNWSFPNVIFLSTETQLSLNFNVLKFLPWNSYTRKVIGYLYAIQNGARFIYDTDDDNAPNDLQTFEKNFVFSNRTRGLILLNDNQDIVTNPYVHFGQSSVWPRGFPLDYIDQPYNNTYLTCEMHTPLIQQGLVNGDPDVDAIFRLTRKKFHTSLNIQFDGIAPPVILPRNVVTPFNSQNTIFHYDAFWALLLPISVAFRVTDIWRGYWAQPLLWKIGSNLGFYPPHTTQIRNAHAYLRDFGEEDQLYKQSGALAKFLTEWECLDDGLYECMVDLSVGMVRLKMWSSVETEFIKAWISDLRAIGYIQPKCLKSYPASSCIAGKSQKLVMFNGVTIDTSNQTEENLRIPLLEFCNFTLPNHEAKHNSTVVPKQPILFPTTLLVVTFNKPHYKNIWLLEAVYRPHYPNILYCGELSSMSTLYDLMTMEDFIRTDVTKFSFVQANVKNGYFAYECALRAIEMKYSVSGYIVLSDDVLLNFWNNGLYNPNEMWMLHDAVVLNTELPLNSTPWMWWSGSMGHNATEKALAKIYDPASTNELVNLFRMNRDSYGYNITAGLLSESDIFYFPESKQDILYEVGSLLRECEVFLEISVPFLITGLSSPKNIVHLSGIYLWGGPREQPFTYFNSSQNVIHPVKYSAVIANLPLREKFCSNYISRIIE